MKKLMIGALALLFVFTQLQAQDGKKALKTATRALGAFNLDQTGNKAKLKEAVDALDIATADSEIAASSKVWQTKGEVYDAVAAQIVSISQLGDLAGSADALPKVDNPAVTAMESFMKALEVAQKGYEKKDALKGMRNTQGNLYNLGIMDYEKEQYENAYNNFANVLSAHKILKENGSESSLDKKEDYQNLIYISGLAAFSAKKMDEAGKAFTELYEDGYEKAVVYEGLYNLYSEEDPEKAYKYLEAGREKFPDDTALLFAEINHYLKLQQLDKLIDKLKAAIAAEPNNISLYSTLGNVYDNLYQKETGEGNLEKADEYFNSSLEYYQKALEIDPKFVDVIYSIGALYYNKAALMTNELKEYANDYSKAGMKKYDELNTKIVSVFDQALPYFKSAEKIDPNDLNTLTALKEIFARKNQLDVSGEFKTRLEKVKGGGSNDTPYFND